MSTTARVHNCSRVPQIHIRSNREHPIQQEQQGHGLSVDRPIAYLGDGKIIFLRRLTFWRAVIYILFCHFTGLSLLMVNWYIFK